jgi:Tfp pilus assembly protein PilN
MSDINLLPKKQSINLETEKAAVLLRRISIGVLSLTVLSTIVLFILVIQSPLNKIKQQENDLLTKLTDYKVQLSRNVIIKERLISIENILRQRTHFEKYVAAILSKLPQGVSLSSLDVTENTIQLTGNSSSLSAANTFIDALVSMQKNKELIQSVVLKSFAVDQDSGKYFFSVAITLL